MRIPFSSLWRKIVDKQSETSFSQLPMRPLLLYNRIAAYTSCHAHCHWGVPRDSDRISQFMQVALEGWRENRYVAPGILKLESGT